MHPAALSTHPSTRRLRQRIDSESPSEGRGQSVRLDAAGLAAATPAHRDRVVDFVRVAALAVVVLGHWLMAAVSWDQRGLVADNVLALDPWTRRVTWIAQVVPLLFVIAGVANAASWESAQRRDIGWPAWLHTRLARLVRPVVAFAAVWTVGIAVAVAVGVDPAPLRTAARLVAMPLWFLAVQVALTAVTPVAAAAHRRLGVSAVALLVTGAATVDVLARVADVSAIGWANFAFVWLAAHQVGWLWRDGRLANRRTGAVMAVAGLSGLVVATTWLGYPIGMVGAPGEASNTTPPTLALLALGALHVGVLALARPGLARMLERPRLWTAVVAANGVAMTVFLWHLTALSLVVVTVVRRGWFPTPAPTATGWWALRPVWVLVLALALAPLVALFGRIEARPTRPRISRPGRGAVTIAAVGAAATTAGLTLLAVNGLPVTGRALAAPAVALAALVVGPLLVADGLTSTVTRPSSTRR